MVSPLDLLLDELGDYSDPKVQRLLANVVASQGDMPRVTNWAVHELTRVTDPNTPRVLIDDRDGDFELPDLTPAQWERVAAAVIAYTMHTAYGIPYQPIGERFALADQHPLTRAGSRPGRRCRVLQGAERSAEQSRR